MTRHKPLLLSFQMNWSMLFLCISWRHNMHNSMKYMSMCRMDACVKFWANRVLRRWLPTWIAKIPWSQFGDGWRAEINLAALRWIRRTARLLQRGYILTIDYGDRARALYSRARHHGTLACYFRHQMNERPLARPGEQDITAHVNFSALINEGRRQGLRLHKFTTQRLWLESLGIREELEQRRVR